MCLACCALATSEKTKVNCDGVHVNYSICETIVGAAFRAVSAITSKLAGVGLMFRSFS